MLEIQDHYFHLAKKDGYVARSAYKLQEIDEKFKFFWRGVHNVIDIGCAPGSWLQYTSRKLLKNNNPKTILLWFDLKQVEINLPYTSTFVQDITEQDQVKNIIQESLWINIKNNSSKDLQVIDVIISDMAPDTVWNASADALRSSSLIMETMRIYEKLLKKDGKFTIKVFMWPWFEELVQYCRNRRWASSIKIFKPKACRKESKETYIVKI